MDQLISFKLPLFDKYALQVLQQIVPSGHRQEWVETWYAELWHFHHDRNYTVSNKEIVYGLLRDAFWLRTDEHRQRLSGTALLCLLTLLFFCAFAAMLALVSCDTLKLSLARAVLQFKLFALEAPLVAFVGFAATPEKHIEQFSSSGKFPWLLRRSFFIAKTFLTLVAAFLLSSATLQFISESLPYTALVLQTFLFVILGLLGFRWSMLDHERRCKSCLRTLESPLRVGRPSHNLLDSAGTELSCKRGHGSLNVPEMVTSWRQYSQWISG